MNPFERSPAAARLADARPLNENILVMSSSKSQRTLNSILIKRTNHYFVFIDEMINDKKLYSFNFTYT